jgi:ATP-binding cassette, subfamily B, bacterial
VKTVWVLARKYRGGLALLALLEVFGAVLAVLSPIPLQTAVDVLVQHRKAPVWLVPFGHNALPMLCVAGLLLTALSQAQSVGSGLLSTLVGQRIILNLRTRLFKAALGLSLGRHIQKGVADAQYRIQSDAQTVEWILIDGALPVFTALITFTAMVIALFLLAPLLGVVGLVVAPPLLMTARLVRPKLKAAAREARERESRAMAVVSESLGALPAIKAFGRERTETQRFRSIASQGVRARVRVSKWDGLLSSGVQMLCATGTAAALFIVIRGVQDDRLTIGHALLGLHYINQIYGPLKTIGKKWASLQTQVAGLERATVLLDEPADVPDAIDPIHLDRADGHLEFHGVSFGYDKRRPVLQNVSIEVAAGDRLGVVGQTGAGKSTLMSLLLRFYDPTSGSITLDGVDLRKYSVAALRRQFAVVFQETVLLQGTIAENIAMGRPDADFVDIERAAKAANLDEAIARLSDGYQTMVGERGHALSGGERQRVGLARAFLRDAPILILDEPTSALDSATEASVLEAMNRLMEGRTVITITHRLAALDGCERIVRVEEGRALVTRYIG